MKNSPCKHCGSDRHTSLMCFSKPRKPKKKFYQTKGYQNMQAAYTHWYRDNPPDGAGLWFCHYCRKPLTKDPDMLSMGVERITLDHYYPRGSHQHLKHDPKNFVACCLGCNSEKASMDGDAYIKLRRERSEKIDTRFS